MSAPMSASTALTVLKAEGLVIQEYGDWRTHNRNHVGAWGEVYGVMIHHTVTSADDSSVSLCYNGHSDLPGPLCHSVGRNDGKVAMVGWGRANHAGSGDDDVLAAVRNETALPADNEANTDGNRHFYGLEIVNQGNGTDTYPWVQYVAAVKWATALCRKHGWTEKSVIGHKEWQPGKIDPYGPVVGPDGTRFDFTMTRFRADVKAALALPAGVWGGEEEEDVALSAEDKVWIKEELKALVKEIFDYDTVPAVAPPDENADWHEGNTNWSFRYAVHSPNVVGRETRRLVREVQAKVDALAVGGVDMDALAVKVADELYRRMAG
jgi:hypothetical protein